MSTLPHSLAEGLDFNRRIRHGVRMEIAISDNRSGNDVMATYRELLAERERLGREIREARAAERAAVIAEVRQKLALYRISLAEVAGRSLRKDVGVVRRRRAEPKYRNPETGQLWSGRGTAPRWIRQQQDWEQFLVRLSG